MGNPSGNLTIGTFAEEAGVNVETIRFYQRRGLLPEPEKPSGSIRRYGAADVGRVKFVKAAQRLGFTLDEVTQLLTLDDGAHCEEARLLAEEKLTVVRDKLADLRRLESLLTGLVRECCASTETVSCPLIAAMRR